jgi:hypothetical protein
MALDQVEQEVERPLEARDLQAKHLLFGPIDRLFHHRATPWAGA